MDVTRQDTEHLRLEAGGLEVIDQRCVQYPLDTEQEPTWKHTQGSLLTVGEKVDS